MKGVYTLLVFLSEKAVIRTRKKTFTLRPGLYAYLGSAMGPYADSLEKRVLRHLRERKTRFWHIDYFLTKKTASVKAFLYSESKSRLECSLASQFEKSQNSWVPIDGFGCSDCRCRAHLYLAMVNADLRNVLRNTAKGYRKLGLSPSKWLVGSGRSPFLANLRET